MKKVILTLVALGLFSVAGPLFATQHKASHKQKTKKNTSLSKRMFNSKGPIHIISNRLDADNKKRIIIFSGHVVAKRSNLTLTCDKLTVYYTPKGGEISKIIADGNVIIKQPPRTATCRMAVFYQKTNKVVLIGNPILSEGKNRVTGEKVTFFLNSEKTMIEGGKKGRVSTTILPKSQAIPFKAKP